MVLQKLDFSVIWRMNGAATVESRFTEEHDRLEKLFATKYFQAELLCNFGTRRYSQLDSPGKKDRISSKTINHKRH